MATFTQTATRMFSAGTDLTCFSNSADLSFEADQVEFTTFCSSGVREYRKGLSTWTFTAGGFQDHAAVGGTTGGLVPSEEIAPANQGAGANVSIVPEGGTEGNVAYLANGIYTSMTPAGGTVGEAAQFNVTVVPANAAGHRMHRGRLEAYRTVTATGNTTGSNTLGALASGQQLGASLHVITLSGTSPSITVKIQSDDNAGFTSPTDRITFTAATTRQGQFGTVAGPVTDTYWRAQWTVSGTSPSILFAVTIGVS